MDLNISLSPLGFLLKLGNDSRQDSTLFTRNQAFPDGIFQLAGKKGDVFAIFAKMQEKFSPPSRDRYTER